MAVSAARRTTEESAYELIAEVAHESPSIIVVSEWKWGFGRSTSAAEPEGEQGSARRPTGNKILAKALPSFTFHQAGQLLVGVDKILVPKARRIHFPPPLSPLREGAEGGGGNGPLESALLISLDGEDPPTTLVVGYRDFYSKTPPLRWTSAMTSAMKGAANDAADASSSALWVRIMDRVRFAHPPRLRVFRIMDRASSSALF